MIGKALVFSLLAVVFYAYLTSEPLPPDLAVEPSYTRLKAIITFLTLINNVAGFFTTDFVELRRTVFVLLSAPLVLSDDKIQIFDDVFDGVPVRLYLPKITGDILKPGIVYMHGGGWTVGSINVSHAFVRQISLDTGAVIVSVEYRLAPEHVFPAAYEDSLKATLHFMKNAKQYDVDRNRIAILGDSCGASLAATVSIGIRDAYPEMRLKLQILNNPITQCADFNLPSHQQNRKVTGFMVPMHIVAEACLRYAIGSYEPGFEAIVMSNRLTRSILEDKTYKDYLNHKWIPKYLIPTWYKSIPESEDKIDADLERKFTDQVKNPYLSPLLSPNLKSLPEAYVMVAEYDVLRDDALLYIRRLRESNVTVTEAYDKTLHLGAGFGSPAHGMMQLGGGAMEAYQKMVAFIKTRL